ncbi:hypothetical protein NKDENANG_03273 [Candidatus Entotheonellaceae bacterium PAL068K]
MVAENGIVAALYQTLDASPTGLIDMTACMGGCLIYNFSVGLASNSTAEGPVGRLEGAARRGCRGKMHEENDTMNALLNVVKRIVGLASKLNWLALLVARLGVGWIFTPGGWDKLHGIQGLAEWFGTLGIPFPDVSAWMTALFEFIGGLCVIFGFGTRFFAVALSIIMAVALITVGPQSNPPPDSLSDWLFKAESILIMIFILFYGVWTRSGQY